ncbi:uncharacterized protein LOC141673954 [Apium graveolens]|uniref:uncharacterized protein LOC141673954 n=1 Tax=Apium graveolens TaxID=4045 RepID=UPI003D7944FE
MDVGLIDMSLTGHQFTWERGRGTSEWIEVRLDRALTTDAWLTVFPAARLYNLEGSESDHSPLLLIPKRYDRSQNCTHFRFENAWLSEPMCLEVVKDSWEENSKSDIQEKVKLCGEKLLVWGKEITGDFAKRIRECKVELKQWRGRRDTQAVQNYKEMKKKLFLILDQREIFWRQRSKQLWLQSGDQNSKYFHAMANTRRRVNQITKLQNEEGEWRDWGNGLADWEKVIDCVPGKITAEQNCELLKEISEDEVKEALFQMHPDKSPGPDGMTPAFYQKHWAIVGTDVVSMVKDFFE